ncbi:TonB-dependent receptor domain-containing protein [uncultured Paludibaculum sp.]|uniref:TonB-dependent receptor n=1 Tax=uncultured Paludibaculum sp. TaxID=1765020 RepID=UPI002AABA30C|nr:TonB-dependent receptor [uncultured Paludibaculum sp.]
MQLIYNAVWRAGWIGAAVATLAFSQQVQVSGYVKDASGGVVSGASIILRENATNQNRTATTNAEGLYTVSVQRPGLYEISAQAAGFDRTVVENLKLEVAAKVTQDLELKVSGAAETVTVSATGLSINTVDSSVSTVVNRQFVENMPLNGRSFQSLLTLTPGVTAVVSTRGQGQSGSMSVNGQRTEANYFLVDGVSANTGAYPSTPGWGAGYGGSTPGETALGTTQSLVSLDALEEFRATTSTYSAEYGRFPGGQFSFTTRSGTNQFHGSLFEYFRNDVLDANNWFSNSTATAKPKERQNNFGGTLGGPVVHDRTFFFVSYEALRLRTPQPAAVTDVPTMALRASAPEVLRPFLNAFPMPNGPESGNGLATFTSSWSNPGTLDSTSVRIDHSLSQNFKLFGRYADSPSENRLRSTSNLARATIQEGSSRSATIGATNVFSAHLTNDARFSYTRNAQGQVHELDTFGGATPISIGSLPGYNNSSQHWVDFYLQWGLRPSYALNSKRNAQHQINITDSLSAYFGSHRIKFGLDYRRLATSQPSAELYQFAIFNSLAELTSNTPGNVTLERFTGAVAPVYQNFSLFVQDEWRLKPRLTLSAGLRWDVNPAPADANGNQPYNANQLDNIATIALAPQGDPLFKTRWANLAPRLGLAWQARQNNRGFDTVVRLGAGLFYDTANSNASMGYFGVGRASALRYLSNSSAFPASPSQFALLKPEDISTPYNFTLYAIDRNMKSPYTMSWSAAMEQGLGQAQTLAVTYIGSGSRQLPVAWTINAALLSAVNPNFINWGMGYTTNAANSGHQALQFQFQRRMARGLQASVSHTWAHTIDDATNNFTTSKLLRGDSDYDVRHNFQAAVTWDVPGRHLLTRDWSLDTRFVSRSGLPVDILGTTAVDPTLGIQVSYQPNVVAGQPLYLYNGALPGGRAINFNAFSSAPAGMQGNSGRNIARGFGATQLDLAVRRDFVITERFRLQLRAEGFNILNHPIFGSIYNQLSVGAARFGLAYNTMNTQLGGLNSLYQMGGPRSLQLALKLRF